MCLGGWMPVVLTLGPDGRAGVRAQAPLEP